VAPFELKGNTHKCENKVNKTRSIVFVPHSDLHQQEKNKIKLSNNKRELEAKEKVIQSLKTKEV
jgi:hypothetical protein